MTSEEIGISVSKYISKTFLFDEKKKVDENVSLLETGVIDSTGVLELISFLELTYNLKFEDDELIGENFDSVGKIKNFMAKKLSLPTN
ncbi:MAG: acyl carrier protein [Ignavibacteriales bacterium]|nr:acyl carrier protein [Ignavibacteriales bacterium]